MDWYGPKFLQMMFKHLRDMNLTLKEDCTIFFSAKSLVFNVKNDFEIIYEYSAGHDVGIYRDNQVLFYYSKSTCDINVRDFINKLTSYGVFVDHDRETYWKMIGKRTCKGPLASLTFNCS